MRGVSSIYKTTPASPKELPFGEVESAGILAGRGNKVLGVRLRKGLGGNWRGGLYQLGAFKSLERRLEEW